MLGEADGTVSRERILTSFRLTLRERPAMLELFIADCGRWEDWSLAPMLIQIYTRGKQPWNHAKIMAYLQACPDEAAQQFVDRVNARNSRLAEGGTVVPSRGG